MTRRSKRELERALEDIGDDRRDEPVKVVVRNTVIKTGWEPDDGDEPGEGVAVGEVIEETEREVEL